MRIIGIAAAPALALLQCLDANTVKELRNVAP
jgi:hypothetical protein